ncbi:hypothetical protein Tco_0475874 [Tanacetum coccineum]
MGNLSYGERGYGAPEDAYLFKGDMPSYGGNSIISSSGYEVGGSSRGVQEDDDDNGRSSSLVDVKRTYGWFSIGVYGKLISRTRNHMRRMHILAR